MKVKNGLFKTISMILLCGIIIFVLLFALMLNGTIDNPFEKKPEDLSLSQSEIRLKKFKTFQLSAKILPGDLKNKRIVYKSDRPNIVSVNEITGYLEAKNNGIATINTETAEALGFDLETVKAAFEPYCSAIAEITTSEEF